ncbi:MAG TPA: heme-binding protein, partial [Dongiaceae bacterium]|nr:heme-binding protein [Dongiaceae bacterium]
MNRPTRPLVLIALLPLLIVAGCGGGSRKNAPDAAASPGCDGHCANASTFLTVADVERVLAQGVSEAQARGVAATFAVSDRVGNVLAIYRMNGANASGVELSTHSGTSGGLEGVVLPGSADTLAAITKAITGAYLSSEGNAFSTRTASQIVQDHFNPGERFQPAGPLFGVQFSQLACSDLTTALADGVFGPKQSPLGLSADPGGFPLYKNGTVVGGVGVIADGDYSVDTDILDRDRDLDELIAYAAAFHYAAPTDRRADRITADGKTLRFSDIESGDLNSNPDNAPAFSSIGGAVGALVAVNGYNSGAITVGTAFGQAASGVRADAGSFTDLDAFVLVDGADSPRFAPAAGSEGADALTTNEVTAILRSAISVANRARAQIRQPLNSQARVTVSVVDSTGAILGILRTRDAPVFGTDVSLQKARSAVFFSGTTSAALLAAAPDTTYLNPDLSAGTTIDLDSYVSAARSFLGLPSLLA